MPKMYDEYGYTEHSATVADFYSDAPGPEPYVPRKQWWKRFWEKIWRV